jgi:hypothetical protein
LRDSHLRTVAELFRRIASKPGIDQEAKDMLAAIVLLLRNIFESVDQSAKAWEKRGYWLKADRFLREWQWAADHAANLEDVVRNDAWDLVPRLLGDLVPHLSSVKIKKFTRGPSTWQGVYEKLMAETPGDLPY